jgi:hypothetical protein
MQLTGLLIFCRRVFIGAITAYIIASLFFGGSNAARPIFYGLVFCWIAFLCWGRSRHLDLPLADPRQRIVRYLEVLGFNISLTLTLAEFSLRGLALFQGGSFLVCQALDACRLTPGRDYGAGLHGNNLGYPGAEFSKEKHAGVYRIAALGDSFAVGPAVPFADNYLTLVQSAQPDTELYNFGVSGAGPREYLTILRQHALACQPDLVLLSLFVGNDITESLPTPRHLDPRRHSLYLVLDRGFHLLKERWRRSQEDGAGVSDRYAAGRLSPATFDEVEARRLAVCLDPAPPGLERKWQRTFSYLNRIVTACRGQRVLIACVLIPDEFQVNPMVLEGALRTAQIDARRVDLEGPQRRLLSFLAERGVPCLDLLPSFKGVSSTYAPRNTHWNVYGNRLAAQRISNWLKTIRPRTFLVPLTCPCA